MHGDPTSRKAVGTVADWSGEVIDGQYIVDRRIGGGSFSDCYEGRLRSSDAPVCFKIEDMAKIKGPSRLRGEYEVMCTLSEAQAYAARRTPQPLHFARKHGCSLLVEELLGPSLGDLQRMCRGKMSVHTTAWIACEVLDCLEFVHSQGHVHRDVKTQNFLVGRGDQADRVFVCDFGLTRPYPRDRRPPKTGGRPAGTIRYVSLNAHRGIEQSRRDDLESAGYMLLHLVLGRLPWQGFDEPDKHLRHRLIHKKKEATSLEVLCSKCPPQFEAYLRYCRALGFHADPDYRYLRSLFEGLAQQHGGLHRTDRLDWRERGVYSGGRACSPQRVASRHVAPAAADPQRRYGKGVSARVATAEDEDYTDYSGTPEPPAIPQPSTHHSSRMMSHHNPVAPLPHSSAHLLRERGPRDAYRAGDLVEAQFAGGWYPAAIHSCDGDGSYVVKWQDDNTYTAMLYPENLRPRGSVARRPAERHRSHGSQHHSSTHHARHVAEDGYWAPNEVEPPLAAAPGRQSTSGDVFQREKTRRYRLGEQVVAVYRGEAFPAVVYSHDRGGTYTVRWADGTVSAAVSEAHLQPASGTGHSSASRSRRRGVA
eukprot:Hpha_TRINITY_DN11203_c0_g1::TRINITY_DN11203_c0_g1_i1::g.167343::m.167343/K02218/CSNK1, CKI; casein kinase 1